MQLLLPGMIRVRNAIHRGQNEYADKNRIQKKTEYRKRQNTEKDREPCTLLNDISMCTWLSIRNQNHQLVTFNVIVWQQEIIANIMVLINAPR